MNDAVHAAYARFGRRFHFLDERSLLIKERSSDSSDASVTARVSPTFAG